MSSDRLRFSAFIDINKVVDLSAQILPLEIVQEEPIQATERFLVVLQPLKECVRVFNGCALALQQAYPLPGYLVDLAKVVRCDLQRCNLPTATTPRKVYERTNRDHVGLFWLTVVSNIFVFFS